MQLLLEAQLQFVKTKQPRLQMQFPEALGHQAIRQLLQLTPLGLLQQEVRQVILRLHTLCQPVAALKPLQQ